MLNLLKDKIPPETAISMLNLYRLALKNRISQSERDELLNGLTTIIELHLEYVEQSEKINEELRQQLRLLLSQKEPENSRHILNRILF